jgi:tRNA(Phe) wybutosine-synthesizing methylase Tyw3
MKKIIITAILLSSCSYKIGTFSLRGDEVKVNGETLCVWHTYVFDKKADTLKYVRIDTMACDVEYVTTYKLK